MCDTRFTRRCVVAVALHHEYVGLARQLAQPVALSRVTGIGHRPVALVEEVAEAAEVRHMDHFDGAETQGSGLLPRPVHLDETEVETGARHDGHRAHPSEFVH